MNQAPAPSRPTIGQSAKIKLVFVPFLILSVGLLIGYSLLRFFLDMQLHLPIREDLLHLWIPLALGALLSTLFLRKRIGVLNLKGERQDGYFFYVLLAGILAAIPTLVAQSYLQKAAYRLNELKGPEMVDAAPPDKYYHFAHYSVDSLFWSEKEGIATNIDFTRGKDDVTIHCYLAIPFGQPATNGRRLPTVWYVKEYKKTLSINAYQEDELNILNQFYDESLAQFRRQNFMQVAYFEDLPYSSERDGFTEAIQSAVVTLPSESHIYLLSPHDEQFSERMGSLLPWIFFSMLLTCGAFLIMVVIPRPDPVAWKAYMEKKNNPDDDDWIQFLKFFIPQGNRVITSILLDLNVLLFLLMVFTGAHLFYPKTPDLIQWGANSTEKLSANGEYWRLITAMFVHDGFMHLAMNMVAMTVCGMLLEPILGRWKFLSVYLLAGLGGNIASIKFHDEVVSCGASGAIFGLYGIMLILLLWKIIPKAESKVYWLILGAYGAFNLVIGFFIKNVDNAGHLGGLATGILIGLLFALLFGKGLKGEGESLEG